MFYVLTPKESAMTFLVELGKNALVNGDVKRHFEKYVEGDYEKLFLELLKELNGYREPVDMSGIQTVTVSK